MRTACVPKILVWLSLKRKAKVSSDPLIEH